MNAITNIKTASHSSSALISLKGRGKASRELAFAKIAPLSFVENMSRGETIANMRIALGATPSDLEMSTARNEWIIGRVGSRLPAGEFARGTKDNADKLEYARTVVLLFAAPPQPGKAVRKLRAHQTGRRSPVQHKVVRAAEEAWSQVKAELGLGTAQTQKQRNDAKKTRAPAMTGTTKRGNAGKVETPAHGDLVKPVKPMTPDEMHAHIVLQMTGLLAFCNKNAKHIDTDFSTAIIACQKAILKADGQRRLRLEADKSEK